MIRTLRRFFRATNIGKTDSLYKSQPLTAMTTEKLSEEQYIGWHDEKKCAFHLKLGDNVKAGDTAVLKYQWVKEDVADLFHTGVPKAYRGKGIAKILAQTALDYMVERDAKVILSCSYLDQYVKDNPRPQYTQRVLSADDTS